ncbi:hypothetical protein P3L10_023558 [Capsicum annuum]
MDINPLLKLQAKHRSQKVWDIERRDICLNTRRAYSEFWLHIKERPLHYLILQYLSFCGFKGIVEVENISYDVELISALVKRWRPETHTFYLRIGEATITLQDIEIIFGMVVDGSPIILEDSIDLGIAARRQMMRDLTGWEPPLDCFCGIRIILVSKLAAYVKDLDDINDDTPEIEVQRRVRLYLLWLCGGTLFSDKFNSKISLDYLIEMQDLKAMSTKAWGVNTILKVVHPHLHLTIYVDFLS